MTADDGWSDSVTGGGMRMETATGPNGGQDVRRCAPESTDRRRIAMALTALLAGTVLQGCSVVDWTLGRPPKVEVDRIQIVADSDANDRRPIPVDLVRVGSVTLAEKLAAVPAADWFNNRRQIQQDNPGSIGVVSWEVVPGQRINLRDLPPYDGRTVAIIVYARYGTPADHRYRVASEDAIVIHLLKDLFTVTTLAP